MHLWAIIPVKPFGEGKSRLAQQLNQDERATLSKELLGQVIEVVETSGVCAGVLVISRDEVVLEYAESLGVSSVLEELTIENPSTDRLNAALFQGAEVAVAHGADAILVLPADLPLITPDDLTELSQAGDGGPCVVIAPSKDNGTNALLLNPPGCIDFAFGLESFHRHQLYAQSKALPFKIIHSSTLALDVDSPADLEELKRVTSR